MADDGEKYALVLFSFLFHIANFLSNLLQCILVDAVLVLQVFQK